MSSVATKPRTLYVIEPSRFAVVYATKATGKPPERGISDVRTIFNVAFVFFSRVITESRHFALVYRG
jgi:hypothetical protein